jgi:hypothetical protein
MRDNPDPDLRVAVVNELDSICVECQKVYGIRNACSGGQTDDNYCIKRFGLSRSNIYTPLRFLRAVRGHVGR